MHNFKELKVWDKARALTKDVYLLTLELPKEEKYGLITQIRRCAVSIPSNIAEGSGRGTNKDFSRFLNIALGSSYELETQLILTLDLELISKEQFGIVINNISETQKMIHGLLKSLETK